MCFSDAGMPASCADLGAGGIVSMYPGNVRHSPHLFSLFNVKRDPTKTDKIAFSSSIIP